MEERATYMGGQSRHTIFCAELQSTINGENDENILIKTWCTMPLYKERNRSDWRPQSYGRH